MRFAICCVLLHIWCFGLTNLKQQDFFHFFIHQIGTEHLQNQQLNSFLRTQILLDREQL